ncbi:MAG: carboxyl-terminal processing protease [Phenylobacterium sp.]|jgi:carboxyl-terminal processing protease
MMKFANKTSPRLTYTLTILTTFVMLFSLLTFNFAANADPTPQKSTAKATPDVQHNEPMKTSAVTSRTLHQILRQIDAYYVDEVNVNVLLEKAIKEVFKELDPHSTYLNEHDLNALFDLANGQYTGLGVEVEIRNEQLVILTTVKNSPAEIAGVMPGDIIQTIDGIDVADKALNEVSKLIKKSGHKTHLTVTRDYYDKPLDFTIEKANILVESVTGKLLDNNIGYIKIYSFQSNTTEDLVKQINRLKKLANHSLQGLLLDLRDNPGGVLESAVGVSDLFLDKGTIVTTRGRFNDANRNFYATAGDILANKPLSILINQGSASASEIVAGALKENHRATIVGVQSYGKGSVQSLIPLGNGNTAIKLTTALYYTPDGLSINGIGITPDVEIAQQVNATNDIAIENLKDRWGLSGKMLATSDVQLDEAQRLVLNQLLH